MNRSRNDLRTHTARTAGRIAPGRESARRSRVDRDPTTRPRPGSPARWIGAIVAAVAFVWLASAGEAIVAAPAFFAAPRGAGALLCALYLALLFALIAPWLDARLREGGAGPAIYFGEGVIWHALGGPLLVLVNPVYYLSFALAGGIAMAALRWMEGGRRVL